MKWLRRFFIAFIALYIGLLVLDIVLSKALLRTNLYAGEYEIWNDIYNKNIDEDLVYYGSSRTYVHINPKIMDDELGINSYNLGFNAYKIDFQKYRHDEFLKHYQPKNVIINLDINALTQVRAFKSEQFLPMLFFNKELYLKIKKSLGVDYKVKFREIFFPLIRYRHYNNNGKNIIDELKNIYAKKINKKIRIKGFQGINRQWKDEKLDKAEIKVSVDLKNDLIAMIEDLKNINANVILINTPEYVSQIKSQTNRKEIINLYQSIANQYQIPFIDYSNDSISYNQKLFYNTNHLNAKGADIFTKQLAQDIKPYLK